MKKKRSGMVDDAGNDGFPADDDGILNPDGQAQRSHAAQMLMKFEMNVK